MCFIAAFLFAIHAGPDSASGTKPGNSTHILVREKRQFPQLLTWASRIFEGLTHVDLSNFVGSIKGIFGKSTAQFLDRDHNKEEFYNTQGLYHILNTFFTGQIKEEQESHTFILKKLEEAETAEIKILENEAETLEKLRVVEVEENAILKSILKSLDDQATSAKASVELMKQHKAYMIELVSQISEIMKKNEDNSRWEFYDFVCTAGSMCFILAVFLANVFQLRR